MSTDSRPTETLERIAKDAQATLAHLTALEKRRGHWTPAEAFEATYSPQRAVEAYVRLNGALEELGNRAEALHG